VRKLVLRALLSSLAASLRAFRDGAADGHGDWDDGATQLAMLPGLLGGLGWLVGNGH